MELSHGSTNLSFQRRVTWVAVSPGTARGACYSAQVADGCSSQASTGHQAVWDTWSLL